MNSKLHYLAKVLKRINDEEFVLNVLNGEYNPTIFSIQQRGSEYKDSFLFFIGTVAKNCGFFDQHHQLLELLYTADRFHMTPVVFYGDDYLYYDQKYSHDTNQENAFQYYFNPIGYDLFPKYTMANNIIYAESKHRIYAWNRDDLLQGFSLNSNRERFLLREEPDEHIYINRMAEVQKKYISLNSLMFKKIMTDITDCVENKKIIGVHARGTDFKAGYKNCAKIVGPEIHLSEVKKIMHMYDGVFLATDNEETIRLFKRYLGNRLYYYKDVFRSKDNKQGIHYSCDSREYHKFRLGYEVLRDMYTLARANALIAGKSGVSSMARIQKLANGESYEIIKILDRGRY